MTALRLHALYLVLGDAEFLEPSIRSIYDDVDGITVLTTHDRDWHGRAVEPDDAVGQVLSRRFDPRRKIELVVANETNEARARNRMMDLAHRPRSDRVRRQHDGDRSRRPVDYFVIVDPDEVYEPGTLQRLAAYAATERRPLYRVAAVRYFRRWTYRVEGLEWSTVLVRADVRLNDLRNRRVGIGRRAAARLAPAAAPALLGRVDVPPEVGVFHHGSYVGPRTRIERKLRSFGHASEVRPQWLERVWDPWTPASRSFHPVDPDVFPGVDVVPVERLPPAIRDHPWPDGYLH